MSKRTFLKKRVSNFNIFFCFLTNSLFINRNSIWERYSLSRHVFCSLTSCASIAGSISRETVLFKFFNSFANFWALAWKFIALNGRLNAGFFVEMGLIGLGFRIRKVIPSVYRFFWGYANYVYLFVPTEILLEYAAEERAVFFFSLNAGLVNNFATYLMLLKKLSAYRVTGFVKPGKVVLLNSGKQR